MSKKESKGQPQETNVSESSQIMTLPGIMSAIVVLAVFVLLGMVLTNRPSTQASFTPPTPHTNASQAEESMGLLDDSDKPSEDHATEDDLSASATDTDTDTDAPDAPATEAESQADTPSSTGAPKRYDAPPPMTIDLTKTYIATITTPRGDIVIRLLPEIAPQTVNNFVFLAREGFYDGLMWHRVLANFMAQGGDPTGTGMGGPGYSIPAEFTDKILYDRPGILAMARSQDPDSAGSQFFITNAPAPWLNEQYTAFGEVIEGQDIVNNIPLRDPETATTPGETMLKVTINEQ